MEELELYLLQYIRIYPNFAAEGKTITYSYGNKYTKVTLK